MVFSLFPSLSLSLFSFFLSLSISVSLPLSLVLICFSSAYGFRSHPSLFFLTMCSFLGNLIISWLVLASQIQRSWNDDTPSCWNASISGRIQGAEGSFMVGTAWCGIFGKRCAREGEREVPFTMSTLSAHIFSSAVHTTITITTTTTHTMFTHTGEKKIEFGENRV